MISLATDGYYWPRRPTTAPTKLGPGCVYGPDIEQQIPELDIELASPQLVIDASAPAVCVDSTDDVSVSLDGPTLPSTDPKPC